MPSCTAWGHQAYACGLSVITSAGSHASARCAPNVIEMRPVKKIVQLCVAGLAHLFWRKQHRRTAGGGAADGREASANSFFLIHSDQSPPHKGLGLCPAEFPQGGRTQVNRVAVTAS
jgi:hypothetical protein